MHATNQSNKARRRILLAGAALIAAPLAFMPGTAAAQSQANETRDFDVPAQSLSSALLRFGEQAGLQFSIDARAVDGKTAAALDGRYTVEEGLRRLLSGSGLGYRFTGATTVSIEALATEDGERVTGAVRVEGYQGSPYFGGAGVAAGVNGINGSRDITATEGTGSFTSGALTIGSKVPQALKDVPQSISVLTSERMEQQNVTDFTDAMRQLPGVTLVQGTTSLENTFYSRGFALTSIQVDGGAPLSTSIGGTTGVAYFPQIDMAIYDHVELLRGAAGTFNGYGKPGGTINLVRKKPLDHAQFSLEAQAGSWNNYRMVVDATSPLAFDGKLRGRMVMSWQDNHYFYDTAKDNKTLIYGIAELDVTPDTLLTGGVNYTRQDSVPWLNGLPRYFSGRDLELPRSTSFVLPWNRWDFETTEIFGGLEQRIGSDWTFKLNLTHSSQSSTQKLGYSTGAVKDGATSATSIPGPRLVGTYNDYASEQFSAEANLTGAFNLFGQRQEITLGANRVDSEGGGLTLYNSLISGNRTSPYQPYPGGPIYCSSSSGCPAGHIRLASPPINVFAFDPNDPRYTEPRNPLPNARYPERGQVQWVGYADLRLTPFDRLHLMAGLRVSRYEYKYTAESLCTAIPASDPDPTSDADCFGRQIGDAYGPNSEGYSKTDISWPPAVSLSYDLTDGLNVYLGYTDIYEDQSSYLDGDLNALDPITGSNWEAGVKWAARSGRLNFSLAGFSIRQKGFAMPDGVFDYDVSDADMANGISYYFVASNGRRVANGRPDPDHECCYKSDPDRTVISEGIDFETTGEILTGWQVAASYTFNRTQQEGSSYGAGSGLPYVSIQPKHNYKLWTSYDFGAAGHGGWLKGLTISGGVNGQSAGFYSGSACKPEYIIQNPTNNFISCPDQDLDLDGVNEPGSGEYSFTVNPYAVFSARIDYRFSDVWALAVNIENLLDKTYYQTVGSDPSAGNWYGTPRSFTATLRAKW